MAWALAGFCALLTLMGALALWWARRQRLSSGLPRGEVIYADVGSWRRCAEPLFAPRYSLVGKPDYLVQQGKRVIPVEVKPSRCARSPSEADILQLAAYCLLVEEKYGQPPYGILRYREATFRIPYTDELRRHLLDTLRRMERQRDAHDVPRSHHDMRRCRACGYRSVCGQSLA